MCENVYYVLYFMHPQPQTRVSPSLSSAPLAPLTGAPSWTSPRCRAAAGGSSGSDSWTSSLPPEKESCVNVGQKGSAPPAAAAGATLDTHLLPEQLVIHPESLQGADVFSQLQVALAELLDVLACFGQDSSFTLGEETVGMVGGGGGGGGMRLRRSPLNKAWTHLPRLGVVDVAVRDGLGQLHDPVVDLISAPALNCRNRNADIQRLFRHKAPPTPPSGARPPSLCCARRFSSLEPRGASCFLDNQEKEGRESEQRSQRAHYYPR